MKLDMLLKRPVGKLVCVLGCHTMEGRLVPFGASNVLMHFCRRCDQPAPGQEGLMEMAAFFDWHLRRTQWRKQVDRPSTKPGS